MFPITQTCAQNQSVAHQPRAHAYATPTYNPPNACTHSDQGGQEQSPRCTYTFALYICTCISLYIYIYAHTKGILYKYTRTYTLYVAYTYSIRECLSATTEATLKQAALLLPGCRHATKTRTYTMHSYMHLYMGVPNSMQLPGARAPLPAGCCRWHPSQPAATQGFPEFVFLGSGCFLAASVAKMMHVAYKQVCERLGSGLAVTGLPLAGNYLAARLASRLVQRPAAWCEETSRCRLLDPGP